MKDIYKISIIVPVFKVELYLRQCIESIISQTYQDLEIILVDDGSPDKCPAICDEYAVLDKRIRVIHKINGGLSDARNAGLEIATGDYIGFVDSDDWISLTMYEELISVAIEYGADISCCGYNRIDNNSVLESKLFSNKGKVSGIDLLRDIFCRNGDNVVVWNKIYNVNLFKNVRFPVGEIHEDNAVLCSTIGKANTVAYTGTIGYYYRFRPSSIMNALSVEAHMDPLIRHLQETELFIEKMHPELYEEFLCYDVNITMYLLQCFANGKEKSTQAYKALRKRLNSNLCSYLRNKNVIIKNKIEAVLMCVGIYKPVQKIWRKLRDISTFRSIVISVCYCIWSFLTFFLKVRKAQSLLLNSPLHGNIGDHAIAVAEVNLLSSLGIGILDFPWGKRIFKLLAQITPKNKVVLITGGGYLGALWENEEKTVRDILAAFCNHYIIIMPQTIYFNMDTKEGRKFFEESKKSYYSHPFLTIFVREKISYEFMREYMPKVHVELVPDMAMILHPTGKFVRKGVKVCLRNDKEKTLLNKDVEVLLKTLGFYYDSVQYLDTVVDSNISVIERPDAVDKMLTSFSSSELVVTDRLHGMIFAAVTETPCIVLSALSHKIIGSYEWIQDLDYIKIVDNMDSVPQIIDELKSTKPKYDCELIYKEMEPLKSKLIEVIDVNV